MSQRAMEGKEKNKRLSVNAVNVLVTCVFLFFAVQFSDGGGGFATKINRITESLNEAVLGLEQNITFTDYNDTSSYVSSTSFNSKGMAGLYNLTSIFIDAIVPEDILMKDFIYFDVNNEIQVNEPDPNDTAYYYRKLVAVVLFLVVCVLLFPLCGICFCCCRCCGKCGARPQAADKKKDTCKKIVHGTLLIVLGTGLLFCVVCAFGSNQQLQDGIDSFPKNMKNSLADTKTFLDSTNKHIHYLLTENYKEFSEAFLVTMDNSTTIVMDQLESYSNATSMTELYNFTVSLGKVKDNFGVLKESSNKLRVYASQLNDALRKVKRDLLNTLHNCPTEACVAVQNNISTLATNIDFNSLPDVSNDIAGLGLLDLDSIQQAAKDGQASLDSVSLNIENHLKEGLSSAKLKINETAQTISTNLKSVTDAVNDIKNQIDDNASPALDKAQNYIHDYGKYRYYGGLAVSCALLLVTICIALGLICGICGKRPDGYSDNCCNKGAGSQFLLCAVMIMFLFGFIITVITAVSLIVGVISEKAVCDPIRNPDPNKFQIIQLLDSYDFDVDVKLSDVLNNCYNNKSAYTTFNLQSKFDLEDIRNKFDIEGELAKLDITDSIPEDFTILSAKNLEILNGLMAFTPTANLDKFSEELKDNNFTNYSLTDLANQLELVVSKLDSPIYQDVRASLQLSVLHLHTYNDKLLVPMQALALEVVDNAVDLDKSLKMGKLSFHDAISDLITEIKQAQKTLTTDGPNQLNEVAEEFKKIIRNQINNYLDRVSDHIQDKVGLCGPLSLVINSTLTSTCNKVLLPWNGFWFSLFWSICLYVIVIIVSIKLANLYQKYKPYGQYVETEYLYDAYADRGDSIPLNSRGAKRGKKKGKKTKRHEERPIGSEVARDYAAGSRPPDGRYADMAPNSYSSENQNPYYGLFKSPSYGWSNNNSNGGSKTPSNGGPPPYSGRSQNPYGGATNPYGRSAANDNVKSTRF